MPVHHDCDVGKAAGGLDPRTKLVMVLCVYTVACAADDSWRLALALTVAAFWFWRVSPVHPGAPVDAATWLIIGSGSLLCMEFCPEWPAAVAESVARVCIILLGGGAFSRSTGTGELAAALQQIGCPRSLVLVLLACQVMVGCVRQEINQAWEAGRARTACLGTPRSPGLVAAAARWAAVSFCARLFRRADAMAAAAELRGFSRPGRRTSLKRPRLRVLDWCAATACCTAAALLLWTH